MQCQNLREKTSAVDQLVLRASQPKWHRPGGRDNDGAPTGISAASTWRRPGGRDCASYSTQRLREQVSDCFMWIKANATAAVYRVIRPAPIPKAFTPKATSKRNERGTYFCESRASWFALPTISAHLTNLVLTAFGGRLASVRLPFARHTNKSLCTPTIPLPALRELAESKACLHTVNVAPPWW